MTPGFEEYRRCSVQRGNAVGLTLHIQWLLIAKFRMYQDEGKLLYKILIFSTDICCLCNSESLVPCVISLTNMMVNSKSTLYSLLASVGFIYTPTSWNQLY